MKPRLLIILNCFLLAGGLIALSDKFCYGEEKSNTGQFSVTLMPARYTSVNGNAEKYSLHHWMKTGYAGGFKDIIYQHHWANKTIVEFEGSAIPEENDIYADLLINNEDVGSIKTKFRSFRKYFSGTGGFYLPFNGSSSLALNSLNRDLHMDIDHLTVELNKPLGDKSDVGIVYERHDKTGTKSRLTWTPVAVGAVSKNLGPSWQHVDESTDKITFKGKTDINGVTVNGEQSLEFVHDNSLREEKSLSAVSGSATKIRRQEQIPQTDSYVTTLRGEKWMSNDKSFMALAYRYHKLKSSELENLTEFNDQGAPFNYTSPKNAVNAFSQSWYDSHTWTGHYIANLSSALNFTTKFKAEVISDRANSTYPHDSNLGTPNGIIDTTDISHMENKIYRTGESFSLQYTGLPRTSVYTELDLEQTRHWLNEERNSLAGAAAAELGEQLSRETLTHISKALWTMGSRTVFSSRLNMTAQIKHRLVNNDYDDISESVASGAKSAFFDELKLPSDEATTRLTWKPLSWLQGSFRYQLIDNRYLSRAENEVQQKSKFLSNIFTYDLSLEPTEVFLIMLSYSQQNSKVFTPAASIESVVRTPAFTSNVNVWLLSTSYTPNENLVITDSFQYSRAKNFADRDSFSFGVPLGEDYDQFDASLGFQWTPKKDLKISPGYSYSFFKTNPLSADTGNYNANTVWMDVTYNW